MTQIDSTTQAAASCTHTGLTGMNTPSPELLEEIWSKTLRDKGRRVTKQRLAVLRAAQAHPHAPAEEIHRAVIEEIPAMTVQSVYVVLTDLTDIDMLRRFEPPASPALYETRTGDNHHHAYCIRCSKVQDVDCAVGAAPCLTPSDFHGMLIFSADVLYQGICEECQNETESLRAADQKERMLATLEH